MSPDTLQTIARQDFHSKVGFPDLKSYANAVYALPATQESYRMRQLSEKRCGSILNPLEEESCYGVPACHTPC